MTLAHKQIVMGAVKTAVSQICGEVLALPIADPSHFNPATLGGWGHIATVFGILLVISEARYWKQWADGSSS